ncbi:hypothetical protein D3C80_1480700 [compost metagenome]
MCSTKKPRKIELQTMNKAATAIDLRIGSNKILSVHLNPIRKMMNEMAKDEIPNQRYMNKCDIHAPNLPNQFSTGNELPSNKKVNSEVSKTRS